MNPDAWKTNLPPGCDIDEINGSQPDEVPSLYVDDDEPREREE